MLAVRPQKYQIWYEMQIYLINLLASRFGAIGLLAIILKGHAATLA